MKSEVPAGPSQEYLAYHEAGHFVVSYALRPDSYRARVTILPDPEQDALGHLLGWGDDGTSADMSASVLELFAGHAAGKRVEPRTDIRFSQDDIEKAQRLLNSLGEEDSEKEYWTKADRNVGLRSKLSRGNSSDGERLTVRRAT